MPVTAAQWPEWVEKLEWHIHSFCKRSGGSLTIERLAGDILAGEYQVWAVVSPDAVRACALTYLMDDETKTCVISHCAGEGFKEWAGMLLATIAAWSHQKGSTKLNAVTRPGWERVLRQYGMKKTHVILELDYGQG